MNIIHLTKINTKNLPKLTFIILTQKCEFIIYTKFDMCSYFLKFDLISGNSDKRQFRIIFLSQKTGNLIKNDF